MRKTTEYREKKIKGLRDMLDFLEASPIVPLPYFGTLNSYADTDDGDNISVIARAMKPVEKISDDVNYFTLRRQFGAIRLDVNFSHEQVCEKTVVRTEEVPAQLIQAYTKEIVEWKCPESLLADDDESIPADENAEEGSMV